MQRQQKITLGETRSGSGPRRLLIYCSDHYRGRGDRTPWGDENSPVRHRAQFHLQGLRPAGRRRQIGRTWALGELPIGGIFNLRNR